MAVVSDFQETKSSRWMLWTLVLVWIEGVEATSWGILRHG
jgi:hypothetical protein